MAINNRSDGNLAVTGTITANDIALPDNTIDVNMQRHQYVQIAGTSSTAAAVSANFAVHVARGAGIVLSCDFVEQGKCASDAVMTYDLKANAVTILSAAITTDSSTTYPVLTLMPATVGTAAYAAGDILTLAITANAGTAGTTALGPFVRLVVDEAQA